MRRELVWREFASAGELHASDLEHRAAGLDAFEREEVVLVALGVDTGPSQFEIINEHTSSGFAGTGGRVTDILS